MQEENILTALIILPAAASALLFFFFIALIKEYHPRHMILEGCEEFYGLLKARGRDLPWYQRKQSWLKKKGGGVSSGGVDKSHVVSVIKACVGILRDDDGNWLFAPAGPASVLFPICSAGMAFALFKRQG